MIERIKNIILISDIHAGDQFGLCPEEIVLDGGGKYYASPFQIEMLKCWDIFWNEWVPKVTKNEPFILVNNGDSLEGMHHNASHPISGNMADQMKVAYALLAPVVKKSERYFHIRGTEAHSGESGRYEEMLAKQLGAEPDKDNYSRFDLRLRLDGTNIRVHFTHHVGTTSSGSYESTAVYKEMVEAFVDAGRWRDDPPDVVCRSHRHRQFETRIATANGYGISLVTPGWQLKTPYTYRLPLSRASWPQIGGYLIRQGDEDEIYTRFKVWNLRQTREVEI
jgi:hypothetical protein